MEQDTLALIGETAGKVWQHLGEKGPVTFTDLAKAIDAPRDLVMQAVGWLAREEKLDIQTSSRGKRISLRTG